MNKLQINKQYLFRKLRNFLQEHLGMFENDALVQTVVTDFNKKVEHIEGLMQKEDELSHPSAGIRNEERNIFNNAMVRLAGILLTLAGRNNDRSAASLAKIGLRELMRSSLQMAMAQARTILQLAETYRAEIEADPSTKIALEEAEDLAKQFSERMLSPMERIDRRRQNLRRINAEQDELMEFVKLQLDQMMRMYLTSHPEFFAHYESIRKIPKISRRSKKKMEEGTPTESEAVANNESVDGSNNSETMEAESTSNTDNATAPTGEPFNSDDASDDSAA